MNRSRSSRHRKTRDPIAVSTGMTDPTALIALGFWALGATVAEGPNERPQAREMAPGVRIERAPPSAEERVRRDRLRDWQPRYADSLAPLRATVDELFDRLESSSFSSLAGRCRLIRDEAGAIDRERLFPSGDVQLDRVLYAALERFIAAADACVARRSFAGYRLLLEARARLDWVDRRLAAALAPPVRLPGLDDLDGDENR